MRPISILAASVFLLGQGCTDAPGTYEDCVLEALEGSGKSEAAVDLIERVCREKFPSEEEVSARRLGAAKPATGPTGGVSNRHLGIGLSQIPPGFELLRNEGVELVLGPAEGGAGRLTFELGPVEAAGVNLVDRVWYEKERIESLPEGAYRGQNELGGLSIGTTFTSRGRFVNEEGERVEEYRALALHPVENRVLIVDYEYPAPPSSESGEHNRLQELMLILEQIEPAGG